jgi:hypothetical protein
MTRSDDIGERLTTANPVPSVTALVPTMADATEFLAILKEADTAADAAPASGLLNGRIGPGLPGTPPQRGDDEERGDDLTFVVFSQPDESTTPTGHRRWVRVTAAVAASIIVVAGVAAVADRTREDVEPVPALSSSADNLAAVPTVTVPSIAAEDVAPEPEVTDPRWCERPSGWLKVCEAASFDGALMHAVAAGGPGLVAVGGEDQGCCSTDPHFDVSYPCVGCEALNDPAMENADAVVWTSPDGLTWSRVPHDETVFGGTGGQQMFGVVVGGPGLVAVGREGLGADGNGSAAVWTSPDGFTWSRVPDDEEIFGGPSEQRMVSA